MCAERIAKISDARAVLDFLEASPNLTLPTGTSYFWHHFYGESSKPEFLDFVKAFGDFEKVAPNGDYEKNYYKIAKHFGTARIEFDSDSHQYFADGKELPSVTQILDKAGLISDFAKNSEQARWRGVSVHHLTAEDDKTHLDLRTIPAELRNYLRAWRRYKIESGFVPVEIEKRVDGPGYCGTLDRIGKLPNSKLLWVIDLKTNKTGAVPKYVKLQTAAYGHAFKAGAIFGRAGIALMPDGRYKAQPYPIENYLGDVAEFMALVNTYGNQ